MQEENGKEYQDSTSKGLAQEGRASYVVRKILITRSKKKMVQKDREIRKVR